MGHTGSQGSGGMIDCQGHGVVSVTAQFRAPCGTLTARAFDWGSAATARKRREDSRKNVENARSRPTQTFSATPSSRVAHFRVLPLSVCGCCDFVQTLKVVPNVLRSKSCELV